MFTKSMKFDHGEEINAMRDTVHRWAQERVKPIAAEIDARNALPPELWREMGELGLHGITVPEAHGGVGMGYLAHVVVGEEISRASGALGLSYSAHSNLCVNQMVLNGSDAQKAKYLPGLVSGEEVGALAMSETGAGSDVVSMRLRAEKKADHYLLNGHKYWITNGTEAQTTIAYAKTDPEAGPRGITAFIIEKGTPGFTQGKGFDKLGLRGSNTAELTFDDVKVPFENVLGDEGRGVNVLMSGLDYERIIVASLPLGLMAACMDEVLPYVADRKQFGRPIGDFQLMQGRLADMYTKMNASRAYVYEAAKAADRGEITRQDAAGCFLFAAEASTWVANEAVVAFGGSGFMNETPVSRLFRDVKLGEIGGGTTDIRRMLIGRELLSSLS
ncbi:MAG: acyl-CoA dehydrogenase family protein [Myxococcota bacterium]